MDQVRHNYITSLSCSFDYNHLNECTINTQSSFCGIASPASCSSSIQCYPQNYSEFCLEGSVRLTGGDIVQEGQLELCHDGVWGTISAYYWHTSDSYVACKQMGYDSGIAPAVISTSYVTISTIPVLFSLVQCGGFEKTLAQCPKVFYTSINYPPYLTPYYSTNIHLRCFDDCNDGDIRLVGGLTDTEGTVEICRNNLWGLVSDINWGDEETRVVCRQLGFLTEDSHTVNGSFYGRPEKTMHYTHVMCNGAEDRLTQCGKTAISLNVGKTTYKAVDAAGVSCHGPPAVPTTEPPCIPPPSILPTPVCTNGQVQLLGGQTAAEGILQYCYNGQWSHFCTLQPQEATVACKQLGYTQYTRAAIFTSGQFGLSSSNYSLFQNIDCGNSDLVSSLSGCTLQAAESCLPSCLPIGIRCYEPGSCEEGAIRLIDGVIQQEGRVEVCNDGVWGSVCDQNWDKTDAHLVCQQLGHPELEPVAYHNSYFGDGYGPILYSNVSCGGWEQRFTDCSKAGYSSFNCSRKQTAGVLCGEHCNDGDIRLVGGNSKYEGTVEICFGNLWGLIAETGWGDNDAQVVCRQLDFISDDAVSYVNSHYGKPNKTIHASGITCSGDEQTLSECTMTTYELETGKALLKQVDVVGVSCTPDPCLENPIAPPCSVNGSVRLIGGMNNKGRLEYCYKESWTAACSIGLPEATVACRQLGYAEYAWATVVTDESINKPAAMNSSYFVNASCSGTEMDLTGCSHTRVCSSVCLSNTITCYDATSPCDEGSVRLVGGTANKNGRLEVCYNGVWGTVCGNNWGLLDALVACKQLGLANRSVAAVTSSIFGQSDWPIVYSDVACGGWETNIIDCPKKLHGAFQCSGNLAGIICSDTCSNGDIRLVGGAVETEGTVELCLRSVWGVISATKWTASDAAVVCNQLRHPSGGAEPVSTSRFGIQSSFVHLSNVQCSGNEETVLNCSADVIPEELSNNIDNEFEAAGVICRNIMISTTSTTASTATDASNPVQVVIDRGSEIPLAVFVGIFSVVTVTGGIIIVLLIVVVYKMKKSDPNDITGSRSGDGDSSALLRSNPNDNVEKRSGSKSDAALLTNNPLFDANDSWTTVNFSADALQQ